MLLASTVSFGLWLVMTRILIIKNVECHVLNQPSCPSDLNQAVSSLQTHRMFFEDYSTTLAATPATSLPVSLVKIEKVLPDTIHVTFQSEPVLYSVLFEDSVRSVALSGKTFSDVASPDTVITIEAAQPLLAEDNTIPPDIHHTILSILDTTEELRLPLTRVTWVDKSTIQLSMEDRAELFIVDSVSPRQQLYKLSLVLKSSEYREVPAVKQELDLRFNMPVLRTRS